jgi:hypothetical protein
VSFIFYNSNGKFGFTGVAGEPGDHFLQSRLKDARLGTPDPYQAMGRCAFPRFGCAEPTSPPIYTALSRLFMGFAVVLRRSAGSWQKTGRF